MIRPALRAALLACAFVSAAHAQTPSQAQPGSSLPSVRLWGGYELSDPSGNLWGSASSVVTLCPNVTGTGQGFAQVCPGATPGNPLYVTGGTGGSGGTTGPTGPLGVTGAQSGNTTSTTPNTFNVVLPASSNRKGCLIQNTSSAVEYVFLGSNTPSLASAIQVGVSGTFDCAHGNVVEQGDVRLASASASAPFVMVAQ